MSTSASFALPKYLALKSKSNGKYLKIVPEKDNNQKQLHGLLQFSEDSALSPYSKLQVDESSDIHRTGVKLVHLRTCYNNKYFVRGSESENWISGGANEPVEDRSKWNCTLFKPEFVEGGGKFVRLLHVQLDRYVRFSNPDVDKGFANILSADGETEQKDESIFEVVDLELIVVLPKLVVFKGNNGKYLKTNKMFYYDIRYVDIMRNFEVTHLQFSGEDHTEEAAVHEILPNNDGQSFRIRSLGSNKLWGLYRSRMGPEKPWIIADGPLDVWNPFLTFSATKLPGDFVALRCQGNGLLCKPLDEGWRKKSCLAAEIDNIVDESCHLTVEEPVVSRRISEIKFYTGDARVVGRKNTLKEVRTFENTTEGTNWDEYWENDEKVWTNTWKRTTTSTKSSKVEVGFDITEIPYVDAGVHVEMFEELTDTVTWGKTNIHRKQAGHKATCTVPPMTRVKVYDDITEDTWEVPFSYKVSDLLRTGYTDTYYKDDGLYTYTITTYKTRTVSEKL